jgi:hypothetical protein
MEFFYKFGVFFIAKDLITKLQYSLSLLSCILFFSPEQFHADIYYFLERFLHNFTL